MSKNAIKGGEFLIRETLPQDVFIPEEFSEEQKMMAQACNDFMQTFIYPNAERIDKMEEGLTESILEEAGRMGLLGVSVPEQYGGLGMNFVTSMLMADVLSSAGSFSTTYGAHTGIGTLPILYYGNEAQKQKYLPKIVTGEWKASYCLTEPFAGSDANSGRTRAELSEDGTHYLITGQKMWITNAGFADVFIVFAKVVDKETGLPDKNLTAFIVEKTFGGIELGNEEHKLGIKGSSTRQVFFDKCPVPVENMLSERGGGFKIAVNILNVGRIKLAVGVVSGCKLIASKAVQYANERIQFEKPISSFGALQYKFAEMAARTYATESANYRAGQDIDDRIHTLISEGVEENKAKLKGTLSGIGTGLVGWPGLLADLPTLFILSLRSVYQIGLCYGYDFEGFEDENEYYYEMEYMLHVFKIATASNSVEKQKALAELKDFEIGRDDIYKVGGDFTTKQVGKGAASYISQKIIKEIIEQTLSRKAAGLVPGLGAIFSAGFNYVYLKDVGEAAYMLYRERFLLDKKGRQKVIKVDIE